MNRKNNGAKWLRRSTRCAIYTRDGGRCAYCGKCVALRGAHIDHVLPVALGGSNAVTNLVVACARCNARKGDAVLTRFIAATVPPFAVDSVVSRVEALCALPLDRAAGRTLAARTYPGSC